MPTRIMFWNVNNFGNGRFGLLGKSKKRKVLTYDLPQMRKKYLIDTINANLPDILVIVEAQRGRNIGNPGQLIYDSTAKGLLRELRKSYRRWRLVPPLRLGQNGVCEGIAVFYNADNLHFTGPYRWPGGNGVAAPTPTALGKYPKPWSTTPSALPIRKVSRKSGYNPGQMEDELAGQWQFFDNGNPGTGNRLNFGFNGARTPFLTTFYERNNPNRNIKLISFHAPPNQNNLAANSQSVNGTARLANIHEIVAIPNNEVQVIVGDFNVSLYENTPATAAYNPLINTRGFTRAINPTQNRYPDKGYTITHIRTRKDATPYNQNYNKHKAYAYPAFGYMSIKEKLPNGEWGAYDAIDNIFTKYGTAAGGPAQHITIVNRVTGSPYNGVTPVPWPQGYYTYGDALRYPDCLESPDGIDPDEEEAWRCEDVFKAADNYGHIRDTSDHMALIIDV